jgi:radical SAM protein with 4Fe4S-binding SPASM domain
LGDSFDARPLPHTFVLELTRRCNNHCRYCYTVWGSPDLGYPNHNQGEMSTAEIMTVIARLQDECSVHTIGLSGGEPLLRKDLPDILTYIRGRGLASVIITNGTLLTPERVAATLIGGHYEVSLLSFRPEVHDYLAGRPGAWDEAVDGMINVVQAGGNLIAGFIATRLNTKDLYSTVELALAIGATGIMYNRMNVGRHNMRYTRELLPTPGMIERNLDALDELARIYEVPIAVSVVCEPCVVNMQKYQRLHFGWCPLVGENSYFTIDPVGNLRICNHSPVILGNILHDSFSDIYYHHPYVRQFAEELPLECEGCQHELKHLCQGGCKAAGEQCYGTLQRVDPFVRTYR